MVAAAQTGKMATTTRTAAVVAAQSEKMMETTTRAAAAVAAQLEKMATATHPLTNLESMMQRKTPSRKKINCNL